MLDGIPLSYSFVSTRASVISQFLWFRHALELFHPSLEFLPIFQVVARRSWFIVRITFVL